MSAPLPADTAQTEVGLRVLIAGGGTGGHLYPGIALAERVRDEGGEVAFVGTERGIEARVLPEEGWPLHTIPVRGIKGRGLGGLLGGLALLPRAYLASRRVLRAFRPDVVVGVGGYASGPVVATAALHGLPTAILEQNSVPGITNRILSRMVRRVFTTFDDPLGRFPARKVARLGNPVRAAIVDAMATAAAARSARPDGEVHLLVFGGSQGARAINEACMGAAGLLRGALPGLRVLHQTGAADEARVRQAYAEAGWGERAEVRPFIRDMAGAYAWADLALCRAGATSLAELTLAGCPALLVPFPHATDDHQTHNAMDLVRAGGAVLLPQDALTPARLVDELRALAGDRERLTRMGAALSTLARPNAAGEILAALRELAGRRP